MSRRWYADRFVWVYQGAQPARPGRQRLRGPLARQAAWADKARAWQATLSQPPAEMRCWRTTAEGRVLQARIEAAINAAESSRA